MKTVLILLALVNFGAHAADPIILKGQRFQLSAAQLTHFLENAFEADFGDIKGVSLDYLGKSHTDFMADTDEYFRKVHFTRTALVGNAEQDQPVDCVLLVSALSGHFSLSKCTVPSAQLGGAEYSDWMDKYTTVAPN